KEKKELMEDFYKLTGYTAQSLSQYKSKCHESFLKSENAENLKPNPDISANNKLRRLALPHLQLIGIDQSKIKLHVRPTTGGAEAWQSMIIVDSAELNEYLSMTLRHEIMHVLHDDFFMQFIFCQLKIDGTFLKRFYHFTERRADYLACLSDPG